MLIKALGLSFKIIRRVRGETASTASIYAAGGKALDALGIERVRARPLEHQAQWMLFPLWAPTWASDPNELWRRARLAERQHNAQEARVLDITLPRELPPVLYEAFTNFVYAQLVDDGLPVQVDLHVKTASDGGPNPHLHAVIGTRPLEAEGFAKSKRSARHWNLIFQMRGEGGIRHLIARLMNEFFERHNVEVRVDPRTNAERGMPAPERTLPRYLVRDPRSEKAKAALARRDRDRVRRADLRETLDEMDRTHEALAALKRRVEDAEARAVRLHPIFPVTDPEFLIRCKAIGSTMKLAFHSPSPAYGIVTVEDVSAILHPDRIVVDGIPGDMAARAISEFALLVFGLCEIVGPPGVAADRMKIAITHVAEKLSAPAVFDIDEDAFPRPPRRHAPGINAEMSSFMRQYRNQERRLVADIEASTQAIRAKGGLQAVLAARNKSSLPNVEGGELCPEDLELDQS